MEDYLENARKLNIKEIDDGLIEIWDFTPLTIAKDTCIEGIYHRGEKAPADYQIVVDHDIEHRYDEPPVWLLFEIEKYGPEVTIPEL